LSKPKVKTPRLTAARKFFSEYKRYRFGIVGIVIIVIFSMLAVLAPVLTNHNPIYDENLASPYSIPEWARIFPQYSDYPVNSQLLQGVGLSSSKDLSHWSIQTQPSTPGTGGYVNYTPTSGGLQVSFQAPQFIGIGTSLPTITLNQTVQYPWSYACHFSIGLNLTSLSQNLSTSDITVQEYVQAVSGKTYNIMSPLIYTNQGDHFTYVSSFSAGKPQRLTVDSNDAFVLLQATGTLSPANLGACGLSQGVFARPGNVTVSFSISSDVSTTLLISGPSLNLQGRAYGLLGTDYTGRDVWSQFVYGARVSLLVGLIASIIAVIAGTFIGIAAGQLGGFVDEVLMRFTDFMLILPFLPLLLIILTIISVGNIQVPFGREFLIILIIALFSWEGIARVIRSQVLSIKTRQFVEASRALGANEGHIIWRHILPNVTGLVYANLALTVPGAILTEAAVTFLGFGDPSVVSWGTMVSQAQEAVTSTIHSFVWWWFLPPGLAIALLSMAFLFVGFALDAVLNPRLRQR
jgi:peptide/nickel transport system permease protein